MQILKDNPEFKKLYVRTVTLGSILFISTLALLAFLYFRSQGQLDNLTLQNDLQKEEIVSLKEIIEIEEEETEEVVEEEEEEEEEEGEETLDCSSFIDTIESQRLQITTYQGMLGRVEEYNDMHKYIYDVIIAHDGFTGWTDPEYEIARGMAEGLGDQELLDAIENAWTNMDGEPAARFARVMLAIINGIYDNM